MSHGSQRRRPPLSPAPSTTASPSVSSLFQTASISHSTSDATSISYLQRDLLKAIKLYERFSSSTTTLPYGEIPPEVLYIPPDCTALDLSAWSFLANDNSLRLLSLQAHALTLERLDLAGAVAVGDAGLAALSGASPELRTLDISSALAVTDVGLRNFLQHCPRLTRLEVSGAVLLQQSQR
ncbi:unnamed protein product, partial [Phaeothamnion confervicola]